MHADVDPDRLVEVIGGATLLRLLLCARAMTWTMTGLTQTTAIVVHGVVA